MLHATHAIKPPSVANAAVQDVVAQSKDKLSAKGASFADVFSTLTETTTETEASVLSSALTLAPGQSISLAGLPALPDVSAQIAQPGLVNNLTETDLNTTLTEPDATVMAQLGLLNTGLSDDALAQVARPANGLTRPGELAVATIDKSLIDSDGMALSTDASGLLVSIESSNAITAPIANASEVSSTLADAVVNDKTMVDLSTINASLEAQAVPVVGALGVSTSSLVTPTGTVNTAASSASINTGAGMPQSGAQTGTQDGSTQSGFSGQGQSNAGGQPNAGQSNAGGQPNAGQSNAGQPNAGQPNAGQSNPGQTNPGQPNVGQATPGQAIAQQMMAMGQNVQGDKQEALEQQANAFKLTDGNLAKSGGTDLLVGAEVATERRSSLPLGLQTIAHPVKHPQWGQALGQRVVFMANSGISQAQITLNPEKLGPMQVKLHMDKEQQLHITLNAQHGATRESIENALPRLKEMLEQAGIDLGSVNVGQDRQFSEQFSGDSSSQQHSPGLVNGSDTHTDEPMVIPAVLSDNLVDYYA
ncbi:flagellar hook-length control protein FliK [Thiomicrorhabdus aquaedulcis]|uniref:flagellar hook-length control protein FliK n=1 Tax=Thiomicrorhabdus aquaedulcis TaxID=2211106 RepID=UPI000FD6F770|nr:flagellar hook-length control protein FliK [Thiomicrorhabdus aquaedulcis]